MSTLQFLSFILNTGSVSVFFEEGSARVVQKARNDLVPQDWLAEGPYLRSIASWFLVRQQANEYMYRRHAVSMPAHFPKFRVFAPYTLTAPSESDTAVIAAPAELMTDTVFDKPSLREIFLFLFLVSTAVAVFIDTVPVKPDLASPVQPSAALTRPVLFSLSPAPAVADYVDSNRQAVYASILATPVIIKWGHQNPAFAGPPDLDPRSLITSKPAKIISINST